MAHFTTITGNTHTHTHTHTHTQQIPLYKHMQVMMSTYMYMYTLGAPSFIHTSELQDYKYRCVYTPVQYPCKGNKQAHR